MSLFKREIADTNWMQILDINDAAEAFRKFYGSYLEIFQNSFPPRKIRLTNQYDKSPHITIG